MRHLGNIVEINGTGIEPVHCITFGSPCQDLSVAGIRAGLDGERSGLFKEAVRIIEEMREATDGEYPTFAVWENVPGTFSSNKGEDFRTVLELLARICDTGAVIPRPPGGKWRNAGCVMGSGWSLAWRVHDAQFWGVPQRRRRIALVVDFGGHRAPEILFERKGVSRDTPQGGETGKRTAADAESGTYPTIARSLTARNDGSPCIDRGPQIVCAAFSGGQGAKAGGIRYAEELAPTLRSAESGGNRVPCILPFDTTQITSPQNGNNPNYGDPCHPLSAQAHPPTIIGSYQDVAGPLMANTHPGSYTGQDTYNDMLIAHTLKAKANLNFREDSDTLIVQPVAGIDCRNAAEQNELCGTLQAKSRGGFSLNYTHPVRIGRFVRRLTPLECDRLQGYPDNWTDIGSWTDSKGKLHKESSDSTRYKADGNSIALPFWRWMLSRMASYLPRRAKLGSLFDGIGGFPLCWEEIHGKGTVRWASEIEEFPIAVTKFHFGEN